MELRLMQLLFVLVLNFNYSYTKDAVDSLDLVLADFIKDNFKSSEVDKVIDEIRKVNISESDAKALVNNLINILERYVYLDIIKKPPQPKENYFNTVDLMEKLKNVSTKERPVYDIFRDIDLIISQCQDGHLYIDYNKEIFNGYKFRELTFISPIEYQITKNGVYNKPSYFSALFDENLINQIKEKEGKKIKTINDLEPL